jgi:hypothetical protein
VKSRQAIVKAFKSGFYKQDLPNFAATANVFSNAIRGIKYPGVNDAVAKFFEFLGTFYTCLYGFMEIGWETNRFFC